MIFCVPYAYDRPKQGQVGGTIVRCNTLISEMDLRGGDCWDCRFILSAGFTKESVNHPTKQVGQAMAVQMADYINSVRNYKCHTTQKYTWGTYAETKEAASWLCYGDHIFVSTNLGHMPRVMLCWWFLKPRWCKVTFIPANHSFTRKEYWQETIKFFTYLYRFLLKKW